MVYRYPPEVHEFVRTHCTEMRDQELAEACNRELGTQFTKSSIKAFRGNHGYANHMSTHWSSEEYWKFQSKWPKGMYEFIRDNSWGVSSAKMAEIVNAKFGTEFTPHWMKCFRAHHKIIEKGIRRGTRERSSRNTVPRKRLKGQGGRSSRRDRCHRTSCRSERLW